LVSPGVSSAQLVTDFQNVKHIDVLTRIFPAIYEETPNLIIFDHNYVGKDMEKIIRRIRTNSFYNKVKICCYKTKPEIKNDALLKAIGVDYFIYQDDLQAAQKRSNLSSIFNEIIDRPVMGMATN